MKIVSLSTQKAITYEKYPITLPKSHYCVIIIMYYHHHYLHDDQYGQQYADRGGPPQYYFNEQQQTAPKITVRNHVPFAQRIVCEPLPHHIPHSMVGPPPPPSSLGPSHGPPHGPSGLARVHSFTTRVYVNRDPFQSRLVQRNFSTLRSRPPSFAYRYHSADRPNRR